MARLWSQILVLLKKLSKPRPPSVPPPPPPTYDNRLLGTTKLGAAHGLGVYLGLASYQASGRGPARSEPNSEYLLAYDALYNTRAFTGPLADHGVRIDRTLLDSLEHDFKLWTGLHVIYPKLILARERCETEIRVASVHAASAFVLGMLVGIAEGQASAASSAANWQERRQIIQQLMVDALPNAVYLIDVKIYLNAVPIEDIRRAARSGAPSSTVHRMCVDLINANHKVLDTSVSPT